MTNLIIIFHGHLGHTVCTLYNVQCSTLYTKVYAGKEAFYGLFLKVTEIGRFFSILHQQTKNK